MVTIFKSLKFDIYLGKYMLRIQVKVKIVNQANYSRSLLVYDCAFVVESIVLVLRLPVSC